MQIQSVLHQAIKVRQGSPSYRNKGHLVQGASSEVPRFQTGAEKLSDTDFHPIEFSGPSHSPIHPSKLPILPAPKLLPVSYILRTGTSSDESLIHWQNQVLVFEFSVTSVKVNV